MKFSPTTNGQSLYILIAEDPTFGELVMKDKFGKIYFFNNSIVLGGNSILYFAKKPIDKGQYYLLDMGKRGYTSFGSDVPYGAILFPDFEILLASYLYIYRTVGVTS